MTTTQILAALIGVYFMSAGVGLLIDRDGMKAMFDDLKGQPMLGYLAGVVAFVIGGTIVAVHNDWSSFLAGFVSLIGWISLAEGVLMLALRNRFLALFGGWWLSPKVMTAMGIATSIGGLVLTGAAFSG